MTKEITIQIVMTERGIFFLTNRGNVYVLKNKVDLRSPWKSPWAKIHIDKIFMELEEKKYCKTCKQKPGRVIPVDDVRNPKCSNCGRDLSE